MRAIQDVGMEILTNKPAKFYVFLGEEIGIKEKYIHHLETYYGNKSEAQSVNDVLSFMSTKHLIPIDPAVYVVRYDEEFLSSLGEKTASKIQSTNIIGTIVCIYESEKGISKLEKWLDDYIVNIGKVDTQFVRKYLKQDFPNLPDKLIDIAANMSVNYNQARLVCNEMSYADVEDLFRMDESELSILFGKRSVMNDVDVQKGVGARSFKYLLKVLSQYEGELDKFLYAILSALLELDKVTDSKYSQSALRDYGKYWTKQDIYNMFMHTYSEIKKLRTYSADSESSIIYLISLLQFRPIPSFQES